MPSTVILGSGIIGLSTAYYLAKLARDGGDGSPQSIHVVEPCPELFASASGKAGGFVAKDWFNPAMAPLGRLSFDLHRQLAEAHNGRVRWGWSESVSYSLDRSAGTMTADSDSDSYPASDLDSDPPLSPEPEPLSEPEPSEAPPHGEADKAIRDSGGDGTEGLSETPPEGVAPEGEEWALRQSRVPVVEQRTAEALAAQTDEYEYAEPESKTDSDPETVAEPDATIAAAALAKLEEPYWLQASPRALQVISDKTTTSQINPHQLCEFLLEECIAMGVRLHHPARATKLLRIDHSPQTIIRVDLLATTSTGREFHTSTLDLPCDNLVIAAGCWTPEVFQTLFPNARRTPAIHSLAGYSVCVRTNKWLPSTTKSASASNSSPPVPCHAVFTSDPSGFSPELFTRVGGDVWLGGVNSASLPLPPRAMDAKPDSETVERLLSVARDLVGDDIELLRAGLCFRPITPSGKPVIAKIAEAELGEGVVPRAGRAGGGGGVYVAAGHGPWGISLSLGSGMVMSEMILGRPTSADVTALGRW